MKKGLFVVFEGLDGSQLEKIAENLTEWFRSRNIITKLTSEPTFSLIGSLIRAGISNEWKTDQRTLQLLFAADRTHHLNTRIKPALEKGEVIVSDRYFFSALAFGSVKELEKDWLKNINSHVLTPDLIFFVDADPKKCLENLNTSLVGQELFDEEKKLQSVRQAFLEMTSEYDGFHVVDGCDVDIATAKVISNVENYLKDKKPSLQVMLKFDS